MSGPIDKVHNLNNRLTEALAESNRERNDLRARLATKDAELTECQQKLKAARKTLEIYADPRNFIEGNDWVWVGTEDPKSYAARVLETNQMEPSGAGQRPAEAIRALVDTWRRMRLMSCGASAHSVRLNSAELAEALDRLAAC